jgi:uncharacterized protein (DUF427 family)
MNTYQQGIAVTGVPICIVRVNHDEVYPMPDRIQRIPPKSGQESVWDYPRPPRVEPTSKSVRIIFNGVTLVQTTRALRVLETSHPPSYYFPQADIQMQYLTSTPRHTFCEYKGQASYWTLQIGDQREDNVAWGYLNPSPGYEALTSYLAFYPGRMEACYINDERVQAQAGDFYGGWITSEIVGPFKGGPGTWGW